MSRYSETMTENKLYNLIWRKVPEWQDGERINVKKVVSDLNITHEAFYVMFRKLRMSPRMARRLIEFTNGNITKADLVDYVI